MIMIKEGQIALWKWFSADSTKFKSYQQISTVCQEIAKAFVHEEYIGYAIYDLFYPLFRSGVVEFYGNNRYRLSPTAFIKFKNKLIICNPDHTLEKFIKLHEVEAPIPGLWIMPSLPEISGVIKEMLSSSSSFEIENLLKCIKPLEEIVMGWDDDVVVNQDSFISEKTNSLIYSYHFSEVGNYLFRKSAETYAAKTFRWKENTWKVVPVLQQHPDGISISLLLSSIRNKEDLHILYDKCNHLLIIKNRFFPIIIERILILNTFLNEKTLAKPNERVYFLNTSCFEILNNIFHRSITIL